MGGVNIMKKTWLLLFLTIILTGCAYLGSKSPSDTPTPKEQLCQELKRNIIFNSTSGPTFSAASTTQRAEMYRLYEKYNCNQPEKI